MLSKKSISFCFIILGIWGVSSEISFFYSLKGYDQGPLGYVATFSLLLLELISFFVILLNINKIFINILNITIFSYLIYTIVITLWYSDNLFTDLRTVVWWPLMYFLFFFIAKSDKKGIYINKLIKYYVPIYLVLNLVVFVYLRSLNIIAVDSIETIYFRGSNQIYYIVLLVPLLLLNSNKTKNHIFLFIIFVAVLFSFKRSALIYISLIIIVVIYYDFIKNKNLKIKNILTLISFFVVIIFSFNKFNEYTDNRIIERMEQMKDDEGSGRLDIYRSVLAYRDQLPITNKVFGIGFNNVRKHKIAVADNHYVSAHNDFLEILMDFGSLGFIIYFLFTIQLFIHVFKIKKKSNQWFQANLSALIIFIVMSMVSHLILYPTFFCYLIILFAITKANCINIKDYGQYKKIC